MTAFNTDQVLQFALVAEVCPPVAFGLEVDGDGNSFMLPGMGGIRYNYSIGDSVDGISGDHVEPGIALKAEPAEAMMLFASVGNMGVFTAGEAKGEKVIVTGRHGGVNHLFVEMLDRSKMNKVVIEDKIQIKCCGAGLAMAAEPELHFVSGDPAFFEWWLILEEDKVPTIPVSHVFPDAAIGSGSGSRIEGSDFDLCGFGPTLRIGDLVMVENCDCRFGYGRKSKMFTAGVIVHSACKQAGHGPGFLPLVTGPRSRINVQIGFKDNLLDYVELKRSEEIGKQRTKWSTGKSSPGTMD